MSNPRGGGEADKFGNRYEGIWTVIHLLEVVAGRADSIIVEPADVELGRGAEFALALPNEVQVHQVKRQRSGAASWTVRALATEGVLSSALVHAHNERTFHFVSMTPAFQLSTLADKAKRSDSFSVLREQMLNSEQQGWLNDLTSTVGTEEGAWLLLNRTTVSVADEALLRRTAATICQQLFMNSSDARQMPPVLGDFILANLGRTIQQQLAARMLERDFGVRVRDIVGIQTVRSKISEAADRWTRGRETELLLPAILRAETDEILSRLDEEDSPTTILLTGDAGSGKSEVLRQLVRRLTDAGLPVLALRLDRLDLAQIATTTALGAALDLENSPVSSLAAAARGGRAVLVIDQLDAVSLISGRASAAFEIVMELVEEAKAHPNLHIVFSCRGFDLKNDYRMRSLFEREDAPTVHVRLLADAELDSALQRMGVRPVTLSGSQRQLLRTPLNLRLFSELTQDGVNLTFDSRKSLFDLYWDYKRRISEAQGVSGESFAEILSALAIRMSNEQRLSLSSSRVPDTRRSDAERLASLQVLVFEDRRWAFFHESFFDYVFARHWIQLEQRLTAFLLAGEQELFRRSQVRQILWALQDDDEDRFLEEVHELLATSEIRYHLKEVALAVLGSLRSPSREAWLVVERLLDNSALLPRAAVLRSIRTTEWLRRLDREGVCRAWLSSGDFASELAAVELIDIAARQDSRLAAQIIEPFSSHPKYSTWLRWLIRGSDLETSREWFSLIRDAVVWGQLDAADDMLWLAADGLPQTQPQWAIEFLDAVFNRRPDARTLDESGRILLLSSRASRFHTFLQTASQTAATDFSWFAVNYIAMVAELTAYPEVAGRPREDRHFSFVFYKNTVPNLDDVLLTECSRSVRMSSAIDNTHRDSLVEYLTASSYYSLQFVLYHLLLEHAATLAEQIGALLLEGERRFFAGYSDSPFWLTRQLLQEVSPHLSESLLRQVEAAALAFRPDGETVPEGVGHSSFALLTALDERQMSQPARDAVRDGRARFGGEEHLSPRGIAVGMVESPVSVSEAESYSDDDWRRALEGTLDAREDSGGLLGGPHELAQVLGRFVSQNPSRFMALLGALPGEANAAYFGAALRALGEDEVSADSGEVFEFVQSCIKRQDPEIDRWLSMALRHHLSEAIPETLVNSLAERAVASPNPTDDRQFLANRSEPGASMRDDLRFFGMNSPRGALAEALADLVITDESGERTRIVRTSMLALADDPTMQVRSCAARLITSAIPQDVESAIEAFDLLVNHPDDRLLASDQVQNVIVRLSFRAIDHCIPVVMRMLTSTEDDVAMAGGSLAAFLGLELGQWSIFQEAQQSMSPAVRAGFARVCAQRLPLTAARDEARNSLLTLMNDPDSTVRGAVGEVAAALRGNSLSSHRDFLRKLIASTSFVEAQTQLLITLEEATEQVDDLILEATKRFTEIHGLAVSDISTHAAADAHIIAELVVRAYSQARSKEFRARALDLIDESLRLGVINMRDLLRDSER